MFKWKYGKFMPYFAPDTGADGGAGASGGDGGNGEADFKALYEQEKAAREKGDAERAKLKASFDQTAHEIAELKKAQKAKMTDDELKAQQIEEERAQYQEAKKQLAEMRTAVLFANNGFDEKDYGDIASKIVEVGGDKASELAESIIAFVKKANTSAVANARNAAIKDGAVPPKTSTAKAEEHTYAKMATQSNQPSNREQEIKDFYKKK